MCCRFDAAIYKNCARDGLKHICQQCILLTATALLLTTSKAQETRQGLDPEKL